jgi:beta-glucosidase-like glycosyl hydrolase
LTAKFNEKLSAELTLQKKMKEARIAEASQRALKKGGDVGEEDKLKNKKSSLVKRPNVVFDDHVDGVIIRMK